MTKRVYEAAKEYGVSAKAVIKVLGDHHIKAGNFTGIDDKMKSILDTSFKKSKQNDKNIKMAEAKNGMEGTAMPKRIPICVEIKGRTPAVRRAVPIIRMIRSRAVPAMASAPNFLAVRSKTAVTAAIVPIINAAIGVDRITTTGMPAAARVEKTDRIRCSPTC